ncbi:phosphopyruvate hydratase [Candidatus Beckwithbacteria bacterium CG23_combo_of_CG06-09_8_20_14_all_34_8]|uniref:Enolase n=1 Tax=Candidatus Beckwithbacteria bacterium CG23_combo_of_CG06-09_8_20_14_all_34_8 TaxID=1974497 RepID=A0A2H0B705_9BACT|nr:MAG: phosphopyruvate hydratase [Candidatus Beckwithbacteria bacterium CG23_combo_of_CG06-09_8_20_14_all_34_8]
MKIATLQAHEIIDSRGYPTVETTVVLENGLLATSSVPSGASTGTHEAVELRDGDNNRFMGKGVLKAVENVNLHIAHSLKHIDIENQENVDKTMMELDGTENKSKLGANAILSVSEVILKASALLAKKQLFEYVFETFGLAKEYKMPQPTLNVVNGGKHGNGKLEFQEFHIMPHTNQSFAQMMAMGSQAYLMLQKLLKENNIFQGIGDEGGFTANFENNRQALEYLQKAIEACNYVFGKDIKIGLDTAASEFYSDGKYNISDVDHPMDGEELIKYYLSLHTAYDFGYLEDGLFEDDWKGWQEMTKAFAQTSCPIIGDDFLTTNPVRVKEAINTNSCNAVLVKPNQIGTITEVVEVVRHAKTAGWKIVLSHRSGETNDDFVADFAVGVGADIVKFGAPARGERVAKYNRLMEIETLLGK